MCLPFYLPASRSCDSRALDFLVVPHQNLLGDAVALHTYGRRFHRRESIAEVAISFVTFSVVWRI
jgi:hypothetical protein